MLVVPAVAKSIAKLPTEARGRIIRRISALGDDPRPPRTKALQGREAGYLRIRVGNYRVVYAVQDAASVVLVVRVGHRGDVYQ